MGPAPRRLDANSSHSSGGIRVVHDKGRVRDTLIASSLDTYTLPIVGGHSFNLFQV
jgi:hypothetical protein